MPVTKINRKGVTPSVREVPTDTTTTMLPMTVEAVGREAGQDDTPAKVANLTEAFEAFRPSVDFKATVGDEGTEFVVQHDFRTLKDFSPDKIRTGQDGKRNDVAALQGRIDLMYRIRERFGSISLKKAWRDEGLRAEIMEALGEFQDELSRIASAGAESEGDGE